MIMLPLVILALESEEDRALMTRLYLDHRALMLKIAWKYFDAPAEVDDVVSDACLALIQHLDELRTLPGDSLRAYVITTTRRKAIDRYRQKKRNQGKFVSMGPEDLEKAAEGPSFERQIELQAEIDMVKRALLSLPANQRETLKLRFFENRDVPQIAEALGVSEETVRGYILRGRRRLKAALYKGGERE